MGEKKPKPEGYKGTGRPTEYRPEYPAMLIEHMAQGRAFETFGAIVNVCREALYEWANKFEDFGNAKKVGQLKRWLWHESVLNGNSDGTIKGNPTPSLFTLKCAEPLHFTEKQVIEHQGETKTSIDLKSLSSDDLMTLAGIINKQKDNK